MTDSVSLNRAIGMRERILAALGDLFYRGGTYLVGVDEIVRHLNITRATLYRHFDGKEGLIVAYLEHRDAAVRRELNSVIGHASGETAIHAIFDNLAAKTEREAFRGCGFFIAVTENPGSAPIRAVATTHKMFLHGLFDRLVPAGRDHAEVTEQLLVLYEGALAASVLRQHARPAEAARKAAAILLSVADLVREGVTP